MAYAHESFNSLIGHGLEHVLIYGTWILIFAIAFKIISKIFIEGE